MTSPRSDGWWRRASAQSPFYPIVAPTATPRREVRGPSGRERLSAALGKTDSCVTVAAGLHRAEFAAGRRHFTARTFVELRFTPHLYRRRFGRIQHTLQRQRRGREEGAEDEFGIGADPLRFIEQRV